MDLTKFTVGAKRVLFMACAALAIAGCKEEQTEYLSDFKVNVPFTVLDKDRAPVQFVPGARIDGWDLVVAKADQGQKGLLLRERDGSKRVIPFRVPSEFYLGVTDVPASETGQNIGIVQDTRDYHQVPEKTERRIEDCSIVDEERICDRVDGGREQCRTRTITRRGTRDVEVTTRGSYNYVDVKLVNASGVQLAVMSFLEDNTYENRVEGRCF